MTLKRDNTTFKRDNTIKERAAKGKDTHVAFCDIKKAFPTCYRSAILTRLGDMLAKLPGAKQNRQPRIRRVVKQMYDNITTRIKVMGEDGPELSESYDASQGVREGSGLSPILFTVFINDIVDKLEECELSEELASSLRALLYADDTALVAASAGDLQKLVDKAAEHANENQYQFSVKKSKHVVFGDDTDEPKIWLSAHDQGTEPVVMKHTDRYTYLGLEFHEMLGAYPKLKQTFATKRQYLGKVFADDDEPDEGPRIVVRIARQEYDGAEFLVAKTVTLAFFEASKKDLFEDPVDAQHVAYYGVATSLTAMIRAYESRTDDVRAFPYPESVWEPHVEKMRQKMMRKRHLLRRIGATYKRLEPKVSTLVANTMLCGNATFCAEITLATEGNAELDRELTWARQAILGVKHTTSWWLTHSELDADSSKTLCRKQLIRFYDSIRDPKPPRMVPSLRERLANEAMPRPKLPARFENRNGWKTLVELARELTWPEQRKLKAAQRTALQKAGRKWRAAEGQEEANSGKSAVE